MTDNTYNALAQYQKDFSRAIDSKYYIYPGAQAITMMRDAIAEETGKTPALNHDCGHCIYEIIREAGQLWRKEAARRASLPKEEPKPEAVEEVKTEEVKSSTQKTRKTSTRKK